MKQCVPVHNRVSLQNKMFIFFAKYYKNFLYVGFILVLILYTQCDNMCNVSLCSRSAFLLYFHTSDVSCKDHFICCFLILHGVRPSSTAPSPPTWPSPRHRRSLASGPTAGPTPSTASASRLRATWRRWERRSSDSQETDFDKSARALSETWSCCWVVSLAAVIFSSQRSLLSSRRRRG